MHFITRVFLLLTLILNFIKSKETLKFMTLKNLPSNSNNKVYDTEKNTNNKKTLQGKNNKILSVIGAYSGVIKSEGFIITAKIKIEKPTEVFTRNIYKSQVLSLIKELKQLNVSDSQIIFTRFKLQRELQTSFLITLKPINYIASADLAIESKNFLKISKLLNSKNFIANVEILLRYDYDNLLADIKKILKKAIENGVFQAQINLENQNKEIINIHSITISVESIHTVYNYKNEEQIAKYADEFFKYQVVDFIIKMNFHTGKKIKSKQAQIEFVDSLKDKLIDSLASKALYAYIDS